MTMVLCALYPFPDVCTHHNNCNNPGLLQIMFHLIYSGFKKMFSPKMKQNQKLFYINVNLNVAKIYLREGVGWGGELRRRKNILVISQSKAKYINGVNMREDNGKVKQ